MTGIGGSVFLNVPYDPGYESKFVALISTVVAAGLTPRCALEIPERGEGQLKRVLEMIRDCPLSIHDLSRRHRPNMPFELGVAVAFKFAQPGGDRGFILLDARAGRLVREFSDLRGIDPIIHGNGPLMLIGGLLERLDGMHPGKVERMYRELLRVLPALKKSHRAPHVFQRKVFQELVSGALELATGAGLLTA